MRDCNIDEFNHDNVLINKHQNEMIKLLNLYPNEWLSFKYKISKDGQLLAYYNSNNNHVEFINEYGNFIDNINKINLIEII